MFETIGTWLGGYEAGRAVLRGLAKVKAWWRRGGVVKSGGFEFFPDRGSLVQAHQNLGDRLANVQSVWAMWVVGSKFYHAQTNTRVVKRLLLPHPDGEAIKYHAKTVSHAMTTKLIREATKLAKENGAKNAPRLP
jgi:hypothetical protein